MESQHPLQDTWEWEEGNLCPPPSLSHLSEQAAEHAMIHGFSSAIIYETPWCGTWGCHPLGSLTLVLLWVSGVVWADHIMHPSTHSFTLSFTGWGSTTSFSSLLMCWDPTEKHEVPSRITLRAGKRACLPTPLPHPTCSHCRGTRGISRRMSPHLFHYYLLRVRYPAEHC